MKANGSWRGAYITLLNANYVLQTLLIIHTKPQMKVLNRWEASDYTKNLLKLLPNF